ncbi:hypothetical protein Pmar_PMAR019567 [Perkinsus marinus ATCC 50983]|uniref:Uncharacterized protein n=1 Tax=Perkinsus marinus (strain ATCC 50983 / TXsc) TaxID=423536 RepID=C5LGG4_PERM5|nr:hypothetical protein Pmar_PMAR019567 [Perkinsus marinus ATCC 50983]EER04150.1 hypothetical protein Pmar_PMAR019567 [Perkinsus marinus ATCC 50983]|eukprot:XP_002772334.1 hypothetical protein Pmar_PMAR019567 [Perkinsus marinus ATCC 50983]
MSAAEAKTDAGTTERVVVRCCKCNAVVSERGSRKHRRRTRKHSSQRPPLLRPKVPYDLQPPYAVIAGFPEYKTDYMQFGNYPVDEMAFVRSCRQEPLACGVGRNGLDY